MDARRLAAILALAFAAAPAVAQNAFVTNSGGDTVTIIDAPSGRPIGRATVGSGPQGVAVARNGTTAYVTNFSSASVSVIDAAQVPPKLVATIPTGAGPFGIALSPNGSAAYVTNGLAATPRVSVIDTATNAVVANVALPGTPAGIALVPSGIRVLALSGTASGRLTAILTATNAVQAQIAVGQNPIGIAVTPNGAKAYVTQAQAKGTVTVVNLQTDKVAKSIPVGTDPAGVAVTPDGSTAFVANSGDGTVSVIDTATDAVAAKIAVGKGPDGVSVTPDGAMAYVTDKTGNTVSEIDIAHRRVVATVAVGNAPVSLGGRFIGPVPAASALAASVLPGGIAAKIGTTAKVYATVLNTGTRDLADCRIELPNTAPGGLTLTYYTTNAATNAITSGPDPAVKIAAGGVQSFELVVQSTKTFDDPAQPIFYLCAGTGHAPVTVGIDTLDLLFSTVAVPDIAAEAATASGNGIVEVPQGGQGAFAVATANDGVTGSVVVTADTGTAILPLGLSLCQTNAATGQCLAPPSTSITLSDTAKEAANFSVFVTATGTIAFDPAVNRIFVRFRGATGAPYGSTSVAVETTPPS